MRLSLATLSSVLTFLTAFTTISLHVLTAGPVPRLRPRPALIGYGETLWGSDPKSECWWETFHAADGSCWMRKGETVWTGRWKLAANTLTYEGEPYWYLREDWEKDESVWVKSDGQKWRFLLESPYSWRGKMEGSSFWVFDWRRKAAPLPVETLNGALLKGTPAGVKAGG